MDGGYCARHAGQRNVLDGAQRIEFLGVDYGGEFGQRHRAAGVTGAAAARDDSEAEFDQRAHHGRDFFLGIGREYDEGIFHTPVGGVGDMRDA